MVKTGLCHAYRKAITMLKELRDRFQLDRPLAYVLMTRLWQAASGPITIVLLIRSFDLSEQGVYYGIIGIVGIQAYFELGLLNVLVSQAGHETAAMQKVTVSSDDGACESDPEWLAAAARMRDLIRDSFRWFSGASLFYVVAALVFGWYSLADSEVAWRGPLLALVPIAAISVCLSPGLSILEGAGFRDVIFRFRFLQMTIGSVVMWISLECGLKLWALVLSSSVQALMFMYITFVGQADFFQKFRRIKDRTSNFNWVHQVLPVQWRVALIGASFHFATQFFTVIVLWFHSDADAAPLGMTLSVTTAIQMLALAWVQTQYPVVSLHHGSGEREKAGTIWRRTAIISTLLLIVGFVILTAGVAGVAWLDKNIEDRFLEPWQVAVLGLGCLASHIATVQGYYVLARRANPLLVASLVGSIATAAAVWLGGYYYSTDGVVLGYALAMCLVLAPVHTFAYAQFRRKSEI
ncbi:MAG TPA: hypothetical protein DEF45_00465 [Rhodopirellula sp.]|nr:hypothetical protein [Rhodopirellula sp.]